MKRSLSILLLSLLLGTIGLTLLFFVRELGSGVLSTHPEVLAALEVSLEDQKDLASFDPARAAEYRAQFDGLQTLLQRLTILESNEASLRSRYETILLTLMMAAVLFAVGVFVFRQRHVARRLDKIRLALEDLAAGKPRVQLSLRGFDVTARIAGMIERTSRIMTADRKRLATLRNLSAWQEAARRHAHEMRTPLTGARLEISRLMELAKRRETSQMHEDGEELAQLGRSALREIDRLSAFSREFTSFARLRSPTLEAHDLGSYIEDFCQAFAEAWPNLELVNQVPIQEIQVSLDRNMIRQVLVNLCENSSHASPPLRGTTKGKVCFGLEAVDAGQAPSTTQSTTLLVSDGGSGIDPSIQATLFEPYTTTKSIGSGMGLGLAICKKIMLDHEGDLELGATGASGTTFHLLFPTTPTASPLTGPFEKEVSHDRSLDR
ncbi:MAG: hypothetical protein K0U98_18355 [Deltaproteobacteria bacterium]|nr:hypothetical protein [Deltaproteobacteria bacterium]